MPKNQESGRITGWELKEQDRSYWRLVGGLIVVLCLILLTFALVSIYKYYDNGAELHSATGRTDSSKRGSCNMTMKTTQNTIKCSDIPNDTGEIVANYINANSNNWPTDTTYTLHIENCIFPGDTLCYGWLPVLNTKIIIDQLHIRTAVPLTIEENAFNDNNFLNITHLTLQGNIEQLNERCFAGLQHLEYLNINEGPIHSVAGGILKDVKNITSLQIESGISDEHLNNFLRNTTLPNLMALYIRDNNLNKLKSETFRGLSDLVMLEAGSSHITSIESTILESSAHIIQNVNFQNNELETLPVDIFNIKSTRASFLVNLQQNKLRTLPEGIFDMAIYSSGTVAVQLQGNNWHCDCDLAWLRNYMDRKIINVRDEPMCISPEINKHKSLRDADFSHCNTTTLPSASSTTTTEVITSPTTETVTSETTTQSTGDKNKFLICSNHKNSKTYMHISTERNGEATSLGKNNNIAIEVKEIVFLQQIKVTIRDHNNHVLIWMTSSNTDVTDCNFQDHDNETEHIPSKPNRAYMICAANMISENKITISALNCRAITTQPPLRYGAWLQNKDIVTLYLILSFAVLVCVVVGAATSCCVLPNKPGSKRESWMSSGSDQAVLDMLPTNLQPQNRKPVVTGTDSANEYGFG